LKVVTEIGVARVTSRIIRPISPIRQIRPIPNLRGKLQRPRLLDGSGAVET